MKYLFTINARPELNDPISAKHDRLIAGLIRLGGEWGLPPGEYPAPDPGREIVAHFNLGKRIGAPAKALVSYRYRRALQDDGGDDDYIYIEFNSKRVNISDLVANVVPAYIEAFQPYDVRIQNEEFIFVDFDRSRFFNTRKAILRFDQVLFMDELLCRTALSMSCAEVMDRLVDMVESVTLMCGGVLIVARSSPITVDEGNAIDTAIRKRLGVAPRE